MEERITYIRVRERLTFHITTVSSNVVLETRVLVSRHLEDKNESVWSLVLNTKCCSFSRLVILDGGEQGTQ